MTSLLFSKELVSWKIAKSVQWMDKGRGQNAKLGVKETSLPSLTLWVGIKSTGKLPILVLVHL
jgi:hypothetical protein